LLIEHWPPIDPGIFRARDRLRGATVAGGSVLCYGRSTLSLQALAERAAMADPSTFVLDLAGKPRPAPFQLRERVYPDIHWYNQNRASNRIYPAVNGIEGLVIHATQGGSTAGALTWWRQAGGGKASAHWIVPDEDEADHGVAVLAVVYESLAAWHVQNDKTSARIGRRKMINHWTLGVEIVNRQVPDDHFSSWQVAATAEIARYCWAKYPNFRFVFAHAAVDPARRSDPGAHFDWRQFCALVTAPSAAPAPRPERRLAALTAETIGNRVDGSPYCCG
jgi:N-acetylmuramoyl-L-alanine amidase